jgi:hypothetical protein
MGLHLWFLLVFFLFSPVTLPLLLFLRGQGRSRFIKKTARLFENPGAIFLWVIPLAVMESSFHPEGLGLWDMGGWNIFVYWNTPVIVKYLFLSTTSFVIIVLIYEYVVRRLGFMRFLFGLKGQKKKAW